MKSRCLRACVGLLFISLTAVVWAVAQSDRPAKIDIQNFGQVSGDYFRGGQPDKAGFAQLKQLGIRTVIDLQEDGDDREPSWARGHGLQYFNIPLSSRRPATAEQTAYFLYLVNDEQNLPVFVHCAGGRHRTGELTAIYRITHDNWTAEQAYQEMKQYGFYSLGGHGPLKDYVYKYFNEYQKQRSDTLTAPSKRSRNYR